MARIVSGGQTGVDRGALDAAIDLGIEHGGWCPRGRKSEEGRIPPRYQLLETLSAKYHVRTRQNVVDSDATLILYRYALSGGTELTRQIADQLGKPVLLVDLNEELDLGAVRDWLSAHRVRTLNVAGPRESQAPGIAAEGFRFVRRLLANDDEPAG